MESMKLTVDTGAVRIDVENEKGEKIGEFEFNPSDSNMLNRYESVVDFFNGVQFQDGLSKEQEYEETKRFCQDIKDQFDFLLGYHVSDGLFDRCGPLTVISNGDFYFENVLDGIVGLMEKINNQRIQKKMEKVRKAVEKYSQ